MKLSMAMNFFLLFTLGVALGGEIEERENLREQSAAAFYQYDFAELEKLANTYRSGQEKTESGTWKLVWFYRGIFETAMAFEKNDDVNWLESLEKIDQWISQYPNSSTPHIAYAGALISRAWAYRGTSYANEVDEADIQKFLDYMTMAGKYLLEQQDSASEDPYWYLQVAWTFRSLGIEKSDFLEFMEQGFTQHPDFDELYFTTAGYLTPKWHGSAQEVATFAKDALFETRDRRGAVLYTRIYWATGVDRDGRYLMHKRPANWTYLVNGMDEILEKYPSQWNINHFAYFACLRGDIRSTKKYMEMIEGPIISKVWNKQSNYDFCSKQVERVTD